MSVSAWMARWRVRAAGLALTVGTSACAVGPAYQRPATEPAPAAFKEATGDPTGIWAPAQPQDAVARGEWWKQYGDPELDALESRVDVS
ncbi:MAG TPA: hypothetical protein VH458_00725, partial [Vicinamibacterales bacterium]